MPLEAVLIRLKSDSSRCDAGMEEGRHRVLSLGLVIYDLSSASIDFSDSSSVCVFDRDNVWIWVYRLPLENRLVNAYLFEETVHQNASCESREEAVQF
jgi:hypothetical protein